MKLKSHLVFNGKAEEAANYYATIFGGKVGNVHRYADAMPDVPEEYKDRILYLCLQLNDDGMAMCDAEPGKQTTFGTGNIITLHCDSEEQIQSVYDALASDGEVECSLQNTFFAKRYAALTDRYGVAWNLFLD